MFSIFDENVEKKVKLEVKNVSFVYFGLIWMDLSQSPVWGRLQVVHVERIDFNCLCWLSPLYIAHINTAVSVYFPTYLKTVIKIKM